jgi:hypothetical protein
VVVVYHVSERQMYVGQDQTRCGSAGRRLVEADFTKVDDVRRARSTN